jgi:3-oxoacyl-[acyl-carrier-protein] synthase II
MTAPRPDASQASRSMQLAMRDAGIVTGDVRYVNAHGSSTPLNDPTETLAIKHTFGDHAAKLQVSSTKAYYGHALGASGAMEAAICALSLENEWLPPTLNLEDPADGCDLDYIPGAGRSARVDYMLNNSFGFGGINACLIFARVENL